MGVKPETPSAIRSSLATPAGTRKVKIGPCMGSPQRASRPYRRRGRRDCRDNPVTTRTPKPRQRAASINSMARLRREPQPQSSVSTGGALGFPALIRDQCRDSGVEIDEQRLRIGSTAAYKGRQPTRPVDRTDPDNGAQAFGRGRCDRPPNR